MQVFLGDRSGNPCTANYEVSPGHPPYEPRARWLGELSGSWYDIGAQVGRQAGDLVRWVSDVWWKHHVDTYGRHDTLQALPRYEAQIEALDPGLIRFMEGVAEHAADHLDRSPFAADCSHYQKVLNTNIYDAWSWRHPTRLPWKGAEAAGAAGGGCSSFVSLGTGPNRSAETIAAHNRHCPFNPKCYQVAYVGRPEGGNAYWALAPGATGSGCQIVNDRGVSIVLNAGGNRHQEMHANAFGVPWFLLFLHVAAHADTARGAIERITRGTADYRANARRDSLLRTGTWNFLVSDATECAVIETTCDRYAIRRPGDLGEIGDYLVMTNHCTLDHSFDEHNERTDVPMTRFGDESAYEGSGTRFWTLMWDLRAHYGHLDAGLAKQLMTGHHQHTRDGERIEAGPAEPGLQYEGHVTCPHAGGFPETWRFGSADSKVAVTGAGGVDVHWTLGRPCEWEGDWDRVRFGQTEG